METPTVFIGTSDSCDFKQNTWTFSFDERFVVGAGQFYIMRKSDYQRLLDAARSNEEVSK